MDLCKEFYDVVLNSIDNDGIRNPHLIVVFSDGTSAMYAVENNVFAAMYSIIQKLITERANDISEIIYGLNRFTKEGQGTEFADAFAGAYFSNGEWKPFVINYQDEPRIVRDYDWNNQFWNAAITTELVISEIYRVATSILR